MTPGIYIIIPSQTYMVGSENAVDPELFVCLRY